MKRIIMSLIVALTAMISSAHAQVNTESSDHLTFKGVPIDGKLDDYVLKMERNGFNHIGTENEVAMLRGDFASFKNCIVLVGTLKQKDLVSKITVIFPSSETWSALSTDYFSLKEMLTEKYGKPVDHLEKFDGLQPDDDNSRMHDVRFDRCKYYATYKTEKGSIQLSIEHDGVSSCFVELAYYDKINSNIIKAKAKDDL